MSKIYTELDELRDIYIVLTEIKEILTEQKQEWGLWSIRDEVFVTEMSGHVAVASKGQMLAKALEMSRSNGSPYEARPLPTE